MTQPVVFISYSNVDGPWMELVLAHLKAQPSEFELKAGTLIRLFTGTDWRKEFHEAIEQARVAILLISADYLASNFIMDEELPHLLVRQEEGELTIIPIILNDSLWQRLPWLQQMQVVPSSGTPLSNLSRTAAGKEMSTLAQRVREALAQRDAVDLLGGSRDDVVAGPQAEASAAARWVFISHAHSDGDFAELLKQKLGEVGFLAWVDADRLPVGFDWREGIDDAVRRAVAVVAVISPRSAISEYVTYEWAFAYGAGIPVIPVVIEQTKMHPRLDVLQHLDFTNRRGRPWDALVTALRVAAEKKNASS